MIHHIKTKDPASLQPVLVDLKIPQAETHKGDNGKALVIGGSSLFHASVLWSAEIASHFVDMLHFASTKENTAIVQNLKGVFRNGIIIEQSQIPAYAEEDDAVLIGPGMVREKHPEEDLPHDEYEDVLKTENEGEFTYYLTKYLLHSFPDKRFVLDAGALQMMKPEWLKKLNAKPILTPHQIEFRTLFGVAVKSLSFKEKVQVVEEHAKKYNCVIMLKAVKDIISDGTQTYIVEGGNQGLTKGGTGDVLAGLTTAFYTKNTPVVSAVMASYLLKSSADQLYDTMGYWYNIANLIDKIPSTLKELM